MKYTLSKTKAIADYWNGNRSLPEEINTQHYNPLMSEFELLAVICALHGFVNAFDLITGAEPDTEKDRDINAVMTAFQMYLFPKMPLSKYSGSSEKRNIFPENTKINPINLDSADSP
jgi:hypothetical protein